MNENAGRAEFGAEFGNGLERGGGEGRTILVSGATGRQGAAVARHLLADGWRVRALTRDPGQGTARALADLGADLVTGDLDDKRSLERACAGVHGVYSVQNFWVHGFAREVTQGKCLADVALGAGVRHFVYSSAGGVGRVDGLGISHLDSKYVVERYIEHTGLPYTIFRPVTFYENFITPRYAKRMRNHGIFLTPFREDMDFQMVALEDVGHFVALAFAHPDIFLFRAMELASDFFTLPDLAATIGAAMGRPVRHRKMSNLFLRVVTEYAQRTGQTGRFGIGRSTYAQIRWNNRGVTGSWKADIGALRRMHPGLLHKEEWAAGIDWDAQYRKALKVLG